MAITKQEYRALYTKYQEQGRDNINQMYPILEYTTPME